MPASYKLYLFSFSGEVIYRYECRPVYVLARNMDTCHQNLPIIHEGAELFIQPFDHRIVDRGIPMPCAERYIFLKIAYKQDCRLIALIYNNA